MVDNTSTLYVDTGFLVSLETQNKDMLAGFHFLLLEKDGIKDHDTEPSVIYFNRIVCCVSLSEAPGVSECTCIQGLEGVKTVTLICRGNVL